MDRISACLAEYRSWCDKIGIRTVSDINRLIDENKSNVLVNICETWHEQKISEIARAIRDNLGMKKIILISGPSSSGKTSFAVRLQLHLRVLGVKSVSISLDDYYIDESLMPLNDEGAPDFEALESIDYQRFNDDIDSLIEHGKATVPVYSFLTGLVSKKQISVANDEVIIVEGIHGLNEKLTYRIDNERKYKIYCSALTALQHEDGSRFKSRTNRLMRRLIRDYYFRNADYKFTFELWPRAEAGAEKNIYPYTDTADIIFNSSLLYEPCVYRAHLQTVFADVPPDYFNIDTVNELSQIAEGFKPISEALIPPSSIIKEFIGGSSIV